MSDVRSMFEAALADYSQITGTDLSQNRFAIETRIGQVDSPEGILLLLLQERAHASNESRNDNQRLTNTLNPTVRVLHALSGNLDEAVGTVSHTCHRKPFQPDVVRSPFHQEVLYLLGSILSLLYVPCLRFV
jgi:hypothetical protein